MLALGPRAIAEAESLIERALQSRRFGAYTLQAAIAAVQRSAASVEETDWRQIVALYDVLIRADPSPVVRLNRAAAVAMADGPAKGLRAIDEVIAGGGLDAYYLAHSARADMCRRLGQSRRSARVLPPRWNSRGSNRNGAFYRAESTARPP